MNDRFTWVLLLAAVGVLSGTWQVDAQTSKKKTFRRAKLPEFTGQEASRVFFDDVFSKLDGSAPCVERLQQHPEPSPCPDVSRAFWRRAGRRAPMVPRDFGDHVGR